MLFLLLQTIFIGFASAQMTEPVATAKPVPPKAQGSQMDVEPFFHGATLKTQNTQIAPLEPPGFGVLPNGAALSPEIKRKFEGNPGSSALPTDNTMAISDQGWIVSLVNSSISYYYEDGSIALESEDLTSFYSFFNFTEPFFDQRILFDPGSSRFVLVALNGKTPQTARLVISFSMSQDPADGWWTYSFDDVAGSADTWMNDLQIGASAHDLYVTGSLLTGSNSISKSAILQFDKSLGYQGQDLNYTYWDNLQNESGQAVGSITPVSAGLNTPYGPGLYFLAARADGGNSLNLFKIDGDSGNNPLLFNYPIPVAAYAKGDNAAQLGAAKLLQVGDCRIQGAFIEQGIIHYVQHDRFADGSNGIRYGRLDPIAQTQTMQLLGAAGKSYAYPVIAPFSNGTDNSTTVIIGFCHSSAVQYPAFEVMTVETDFSASIPVLAKAGTSAILSATDTVIPWGKYSGICRRHNAAIPTVWFFGSYGKNNQYGNWLAEVVPLGSGLNSPCEQAVELFCGATETGSTAGNTQLLPDCGSPLGTAPGKWFRLVGSGTNVELSTCSPQTNFDTKLAVFSGSCSNLTCEASADNSTCGSGANKAVVSFFAEDGDEYFIFVTGAGTASGMFSITAACIPLPTTCGGDQILSTCNGTIVDGSGNSPYSNNLHCTWTISPVGATSVTLNFNSFDTEYDFDFLRVYDGIDETGTLLGAFSGDTLPDPVTAPSGKMFLVFKSDGAVDDAGWAANYSCSTVQSPVAEFTANPLSGTAPLTVNFTNLSSNSPTTYSWDFGDTGSSAAVNPSHTYTNPGVYTVKLTASNIAGTNTRTRSNYITVSAGAQVPVAAFSASSVCGQGSLTVDFQDMSSNSPSNWLWDFGNGQTSTLQHPTHTYNTPGTYTVKLTAGNAAGSDVEEKTSFITVWAPLTITATPGNTACVGQAVTLQVSGQASYAWAGIGLSSNNGNTVTASPNIAGTYSYSVTGSSAGCTSLPGTISITFFPIPLVNISVYSSISCVGTPVTLTASGADSYQWVGNGLQQTTGTSVSANPAMPGAYAYQVVGTANQCPSAPQTVSIQFNSAPVISLTPTTATLCAGEALTLMATGATSYSWTGPGLSGVTNSTVIVTPPIGTTQYTVTGTVNGCQSNPKIATITVNPSPVVSVTGNSGPVCLGDTAWLTASGAMQYQWSGSNIVSTNGAVVAIAPVATGTFSYQVTGTSNACTSEPQNVLLTVISNPLSVTATQSGCPGPNLVFTANVVNGAAINNITWYLNGQAVWAGPSYTLINAANGNAVYCTASPQNAAPCTLPLVASSNIVTVDCIPLAANEAQTLAGIRAVPNPNSGIFNLEINAALSLQANISVFNAMGQLVLQQPCAVAAGQGSYAVDIHAQPSGLYWLKLESAGRQEVLRFVKE